jgi:AbrB family looped-hinge helix DNA binding protein
MLKFSENTTTALGITMTAKDEKETCCTPGEDGCCKVVSVISIDDRGQMVLPKEVREKAKIRPGDRLMVSDIVLLKELPDFIKVSAEAYTGCVSGALLKEDYLGAIKSAGFWEVNVIDESEFPLDLASSGQTCQIDSGDQKASIEALREIGDSIISIKVGAVKPNAS